MHPQLARGEAYQVLLLLLLDLYSYVGDTPGLD